MRGNCSASHGLGNGIVVRYIGDYGNHHKRSYGARILDVYCMVRIIICSKKPWNEPWLIIWFSDTYTARSNAPYNLQNITECHIEYYCELHIKMVFLVNCLAYAVIFVISWVVFRLYGLHVSSISRHSRLQKLHTVVNVEIVMSRLYRLLGTKEHMDILLWLVRFGQF